MCTVTLCGPDCPALRPGSGERPGSIPLLAHPLLANPEHERQDASRTIVYAFAPFPPMTSNYSCGEEKSGEKWRSGVMHDGKGKRRPPSLCAGTRRSKAPPMSTRWCWARATQIDTNRSEDDRMGEFKLWQTTLCRALFWQVAHVSVP